MSVDVSQILAQVDAFRANWKREADNVKLLASAGSGAIADSIENQLDNVVAEINKGNYQNALDSLDSADKSIKRYQQLAQANNVYTAMKVSTVFGSDDVAGDIGAITNVGNVGATAVKSLVPAPIQFASSLLPGNADLVGKAFEQVDKAGAVIGNTAIAQGLQKGVEATVGKTAEAVAGVKIAPSRTGYKVRGTHQGRPIIFYEGDGPKKKGKQTVAGNGYVPLNAKPNADGQYDVLYGREAAEAWTLDAGLDLTPDEAGNTAITTITEDATIGDVVSGPGNAIEFAQDSMSEAKLNPFAKGDNDLNVFERSLPWNWWTARREMKAEDAENEAYWQEQGYSTKPSEWTNADIRTAETDWQENFVRPIEMEAQAEQEEKDYNMFSLMIRGKPIKMYSSGSGENLNYYMENFSNDNFGFWKDDEYKQSLMDKFTPDQLVDNSGRPTQKLIDYAKKFNRPLHLYHTNEDMVDSPEFAYGSEYAMPMIINPEEDLFHARAGVQIRGIEKPSWYGDGDEGMGSGLDGDFESLLPKPGEVQSYNPETETYETKIIDDPQSNYMRDERGDLQYKGEINMDADPRDMGNGWYDNEFLGAVYQTSDEEDGWVYSPDMGWIYESSNENGDEWIYTEDQGWLYPYIDEQSGEKWLWGNDENAWVEKGNATGDEWGWEREPEPEPEVQLVAEAETEQEAPIEYTDEEMQRAFIDEFMYNEPQSTRDLAYKLKRKDAIQMGMLMTDGKYDHSKGNKWALGQIPQFDYQGLQTGLFTGQAIQSGMNYLNNQRNQVGSGGTQDIKSQQPGMPAIQQQAPAPSAPIWLPWVQAEGGMA